MRRSVFVVAFAVACRRDAPAPPDPPKAPPAPAASVAKVLSLVSTTKVEQVIGDFDKHTKTKTRSQTSARFGVLGTDLGQSFEHAGKVYFLFGDTIGPGGGGDPIGYATSPDADGGLSLSFVGEGEGNYLKVKPDGKKMAGFEVPIAGIDLGGTAYLVCKIDHAGDDEDGPTDRAVIVRFDEANGKFPIVRTLSTLPDGHFVKVALVRDGEWIYIFGSGRYRRSSVYLQRVRAKDFVSGAGTQYFKGMQLGEPRFATAEADAQPVVDHPTVGDVSVTRAGDLWLMTYDARDPHRVVLRWSTSPFGPWSAPIALFALADGLGKFIHDPAVPGSSFGPIIGKADAATRRGGAYGPYVIERWTRRAGERLTIHYLLSTWNPYTVVLMKSELRFGKSP